MKWKYANSIFLLTSHPFYFFSNLPLPIIPKYMITCFSAPFIICLFYFLGKRKNFLASSYKEKKCSHIIKSLILPSQSISLLANAKRQRGLWMVSSHIPLCYQPKSCSFKIMDQSALRFFHDFKWFLYINTTQIDRMEGS